MRIVPSILLIAALAGCASSSTDDNGSVATSVEEGPGCDQDVWASCKQSEAEDADCSAVSGCVEVAQCWAGVWAGFADCLAASSSCDCDGATCDDLDNKSAGCDELADCRGETECDDGECSADCTAYSY